MDIIIKKLIEVFNELEIIFENSTLILNLGLIIKTKFSFFK